MKYAIVVGKQYVSRGKGNVGWETDYQKVKEIADSLGGEVVDAEKLCKGEIVEVVK